MYSTTGISTKVLRPDNYYINTFNTKKGNIFGFVSAVLILGMILSSINLGRADQVFLTPKTCLGTFENADKATGAPESKDQIAVQNDQSAKLAYDKTGDLYCANFDAEIPEKKKATSVSLKIYWKSEQAQISTDKALFLDSPIDFSLSSSTSATTSINLDQSLTTENAPTSSTEASTSTVNNAIEPNVGEMINVIPNSNPDKAFINDDTNKNATNTQSSINRYLDYALSAIFSRAHAEDLSTTQQNTLIDQVNGSANSGNETEASSQRDQESTVNQIAENVTPNDGSLGLDSLSQDSPSTTSVIASTTYDQNGQVDSSTTNEFISQVSNESVISYGNGEVMAIKATINQTDYFTLATVTKEMLLNKEFEVPVFIEGEELSFDLIRKMQISFTHIDSIDARPDVFIDGMELVVDYEDVSINDAETVDPPTSFKMAEKTNILPGYDIVSEEVSPGRHELKFVSDKLSLGYLYVTYKGSNTIAFNVHTTDSYYTIQPDTLGTGVYDVYITESECNEYELFICSESLKSLSIAISPKKLTISTKQTEKNELISNDHSVPLPLEKINHNEVLQEINGEINTFVSSSSVELFQNSEQIEVNSSTLNNVELIEPDQRPDPISDESDTPPLVQ